MGPLYCAKIIDKTSNKFWADILYIWKTVLHNSNSNSTFIALNLRQKTDSKAHHTKTLFNIQKPETLQGSAPRRKQKGDWKFRVSMLFQRGMTSTLT